MSAPQNDARAHIARITAGLPDAQIDARLSPKHPPAPQRVPGATKSDPCIIDRRWALLPWAEAARGAIADAESVAEHAAYTHNIENYIAR